MSWLTLLYLKIYSQFINKTIKPHLTHRTFIST